MTQKVDANQTNFSSNMNLWKYNFILCPKKRILLECAFKNYLLLQQSRISLDCFTDYTDKNHTMLYKVKGGSFIQSAFKNTTILKKKKVI